MTHPAIRCCCAGEEPTDGHTRVEILNYRSVAARAFVAEWVGAADVAAATPPTGLDWTCGFTRSLASSGIVAVPGTPDLYFLRRTETVDARSTWLANTTWSIPYTGSASASRTVTGWKIASGVSTSLSQSISEVTDSYDLATTRPGGDNSSGSGCVVCGTEAGDDIDVTIHVEYKHRATYAAARVAFQVYGASGTYSAWTVEVGGGELRVRDGGGTLKYTFTLASYTLGGLRTAVNALSELVAIGGDVGGSSAVSSYTATELRDLAATAVTASSFTAANIPLRLAGETYEDYQTTGEPRYYVEDDNGSATVSFAHFGGSESQFETGYEYRWTSASIRDGTALEDARAFLADPVAQLTKDYGSFTCGTSPPTATTPSCPAVDPYGMVFSSLPTVAPFTLGSDPFFSDVYPRSGTAYQEALATTLDESVEYEYDGMQVCGLPPGSDSMPIDRREDRHTFWGARAKWKLTRI